MYSGEKGIFLIDLRVDENTSIEVDRAVYFGQFYSFVARARYVLSRDISARTAFRIVVKGQRRVKKHTYAAFARQDDPIIKVYRTNETT